MYNISVYLWKQTWLTHMSHPHMNDTGTGSETLRNWAHHIHRQFSSPKFSTIYTKRKLTYMVQFTKTGDATSFTHRHLQLKRVDSVSRVWGNLQAVCWKEKQEVYILSNMNIPPVEGKLQGM
jgi:hypothetical protein